MRKDVVRFAELAGVSAQPVGPSVPWERSREACGVEFPADYREFIDLLGPGDLRGYLGVSAPWPWYGSPQGETGFAGFTGITTDEMGPVFRKMREEDPALCPFPIFPEKGGLLAWGGTVQGDQFFWLTSDPDPMEWPVVAWFRGKDLERAWRRYNMRFLAFLLHALAGEDPDMRELLDWPDEPIWRAATSEGDGQQDATPGQTVFPSPRTRIRPHMLTSIALSGDHPPLPCDRVRPGSALAAARVTVLSGGSARCSGHERPLPAPAVHRRRPGGHQRHLRPRVMTLFESPHPSLSGRTDPLTLIPQRTGRPV